MTRAAPSWQWYNDNADIYEEMDPAILEFGRALIDYADPAPGSRLLDVGAGRGAVVRVALGRGCVVTAVDAAPAMVTRLRSDFPTIDVSQMDAHHFDFPNASFDIVTAGFVIDLLTDPAAALTEIHRILRPGGVIALSVPGPLPYRARWEWLVELAQEFYPGSVHPDTDPPTAPEPAILLAEAGFTGITRKDVVHRQPIRNPAALWELFNSRLPTAVSAGWIAQLPPSAAAEFRQRFLAGAERMHTLGGIAFDRYLILYRALVG